MKFIFLVTAIIFSSSVSAKEGEKFQYPREIICKPVTQVSVNVINGIRMDKDMIKEHVFEYLANGKYSYKKTDENKYPTVFDSALSNEDEVLNIYRPGIYFSVALYGNRYVMSSNMAGDHTRIRSVLTIILQGKCEVKWK